MSFWNRPRLARLRRRKAEPVAPPELVAPSEPVTPPEPEVAPKPPRPPVEMPTQPARRKRLPRPRLPRRTGGGGPGRFRRLVRRIAMAIAAAPAAVVGAIARAVDAVARALAPAGRFLAVVARELGVAIEDTIEKAVAAWMGLDLYIRRRIAFGVGIAAIVVAFGLFAVPALPCQFPGGDACPPPDNAASVVPADALAYVHIDTDTSSGQYQAAA